MLRFLVIAWPPVFARPQLVEIVLDSWRFLQRERDVRMFGYVIMENHLHMHANPIRRGYVDDALHWRYSSARNYAGMNGLIETTRTETCVFMAGPFWQDFSG